MKTEVKKKVTNDSRQCLKTIRRWKYQKEERFYRVLRKHERDKHYGKNKIMEQNKYQRTFLG